MPGCKIEQVCRVSATFPAQICWPAPVPHGVHVLDYCCVPLFSLHPFASVEKCSATFGRTVLLYGSVTEVLYSDFCFTSWVVMIDCMSGAFWGGPLGSAFVHWAAAAPKLLPRRKCVGQERVKPSRHSTVPCVLILMLETMAENAKLNSKSESGRSGSTAALEKKHLVVTNCCRVCIALLLVFLSLLLLLLLVGGFKCWLSMSYSTGKVVQIQGGTLKPPTSFCLGMSWYVQKSGPRESALSWCSWSYLSLIHPWGSRSWTHLCCSLFCCMLACSAVHSQ